MTKLNSLNKTVVHTHNLKNEVKPLISRMGSTQFNVRMFSSLATSSSNLENFRLDSNYITGFTDGEGYFSINLAKSAKVHHG